MGSNNTRKENIDTNHKLIVNKPRTNKRKRVKIRSNKTSKAIIIRIKQLNSK